METGLISLCVLLFLQLLGFSFWLGRLSQDVRNLKEDIGKLNNHIGTLASRLMDVENRLSRLEGKLEGKLE